MAKVFTITEGLENLGAMKTGGQGSVYKGRRIGEIITAIKLLPTPIYSESVEDKNFVDFQNEVQKLKKVNEKPNPNVVKILSSGVTDTGNFPFIEMEYIEGPDLEELLKPPHSPVFTIKEALKVADQLSHALAHCHKIEVRHGDIKSNNVKFNIHTGNYVLLDFGLAVMSDEQRRSSLRHAGAIEFMAPEQNEGQMLFQTDVYGFGVIMFEMLAGTVPFPLHDKGETARNAVRLSHMETPPPDLLKLRQAALDKTWSDDKKEHEMHVPEWLVNMVYKCLEKKPEDRFANGIALNEYIIRNSTLAAKKEEASAEQSGSLMLDNKKLLGEKEQLQKAILQYQQEVSTRDKELEELKAIVINKDSKVQELKQQRTVPEAVYIPPATKGVSRTAFIAVLLLAVALAAFAAYSFFGNNHIASQQLSNANGVNLDSTSTSTSNGSNDINAQPNENKDERLTNDQLPVNGVMQPANPGANPNTNQTANNAADATTNDATSQRASDANQSADSTKQADDKNKDKETANKDDQKSNKDQNSNDNDKQPKVIGQYKVTAKAYFYSQPDESTRRDVYIVPTNNPIVKAVDDQNGFVYVMFTSVSGESTQGWLRKKDLNRID